NPLYRNMHYTFFVAENGRGEVLGFAEMSHAGDSNFCFLDLIGLRKTRAGRGIGSALYRRVREEALHLRSVGIFMECLTDDPKAFPDKAVLKENRSRLRFYEQSGARPVMIPAYEVNSLHHYPNPYFLLFDDIGTGRGLPLPKARKIVRAVLERKYAGDCTEKDIRTLLLSMRDDPVPVRPPRYLRHESSNHRFSVPVKRKIPLIINNGHEIHHIREKGYVEAPVRITSILKHISKSDLFTECTPSRYSERRIRAVHDRDFVAYFKKVSARVPEGTSLYPDVFPIRRNVRAPRKLVSRAGYYCIDVYSPINRNSYITARRAVDCALTGADRILGGGRIAYALVRPPGHHAGRDSFGGFCYFNSTAIAAEYLSSYGRAAILDLDYHHGNGQQEIFYERSDVLTVSIHGDPDFEYPHFSGFSDERGDGEGAGYNYNIPLPEGIDGTRYTKALTKALQAIKKFDPDFLLIALGLDTAKGDPTGTWNLVKEDFERNGLAIGALRVPVLVVQEGGYDSKVLGANVLSFFRGLFTGMYG
ncbi:MAG TPA: histone deacetylase family protein, partial [Spirochaetota bacterium]|nr:histone deacetylase family protein [Spirochaetota bacterium]